LQASIALSTMFGPVVYRLGRELVDVRYDGRMRELSSLDYAGWCVRVPGGGPDYPKVLVPGAAHGVRDDGFTYDKIVPSLPYQMIVVSVGTSLRRVVMETAMYLVWTHVIGGAMIDILFVSEEEEYTRSAMPVRRWKTAKTPLIHVVDARSDFRPNIGVAGGSVSGEWDNVCDDVIEVHHAE
jgi:hypothetical protein